tara:strand:- start:1071 stop:1430 length:360 start_codon:yes stop_codon:yes gene_type:complete
MVAITVSQAELNSLSKADLEKYLEGSGKPIGAPFTIEGETVSWSDGVDTSASRPKPEPVVEESAPEPVEEIVEEDDTPDVDLTSMSKQAIVDYVAEQTGTNLSIKLKKDDLIAAAVGAL